MLKSIFLLLVYLFPPFVQAESRSVAVSATSGRKCQAYLHLPDATNAKLPLVAVATGTGLYTLSGSKSGMGTDLLVKEGKIAVLNIDKPGILSNPSNQQGYDVDKRIFVQYTVRDLIDCMGKALEWAITQKEVDADSGVILLGHSEGAIVQTRLYETLVQKKSELSKKVKAIFLSGTPLTSMQKIVDSQLKLENGKMRHEFKRAYRTKNDEWFLNWSETGWAWFEDLYHSNSVRDSLENLVWLKAPAHFVVFQGLTDANVYPSPLIAYEKLNNLRASQKKPSLDLNVHYYQAGHSLTTGALESILMLILGCTNHNSPFCG